MAPSSKVGFKSNETDFCEVCIQPHVRQKHEVLDEKGNKVVICSDHRLICTYYCISCEMIVCYMCLNKHSAEKHEVTSLQHQVSEIMKELNKKCEQDTEVREQLTLKISESTTNLKELIELKSSLVQNDSFDNKLHKVLAKAISKKDAKLKRCSKKFEESMKSFSAVNENYKKRLSQIDSLQILKDSYLKLSSSCLVKEYKQNQVEPRIEKQWEQTAISLQSFPTEVLTRSEILEHNLEECFELVVENFSIGLSNMLEIEKNLDVSNVDEPIPSSFSEKPADSTTSQVSVKTEKDSNSNVAMNRNLDWFRASGKVVSVSKVKEVQIGTCNASLCVACLDENNIVHVEFHNVDGTVSTRSFAQSDGSCFKLWSCYQGFVIMLDNHSNCVYLQIDRNNKLISERGTFLFASISNVVGIYQFDKNYHAISHYRPTRKYKQGELACYHMRTDLNCQNFCVRTDLDIDCIFVLSYCTRSGVELKVANLNKTNNDSVVKTVVCDNELSLPSVERLFLEKCGSSFALGVQAQICDELIFKFRYLDVNMQPCEPIYKQTIKTGLPKEDVELFRHPNFEVRDIRFFNNDCFILTKYDEILRHKNFLKTATPLDNC